MKADKLYAVLEKDFIKKGMTDEWAQYMNPIKDLISDNFKKRSMGVVCDFADDINKIYTAVFPSDNVLKYIIHQGTKDAMLFVHHAAAWDIRNAPELWKQMNRNLLNKFKENKISIYNFHVPLDNIGLYSTGTALANAMELKVKKPFGEYRGGLCGVICETEFKTIKELKEKYENAVNHKVRLYKYGAENIKDRKVAIITGGGNNAVYLKELFAEGINVFLTGISIKNKYSKEAHKFAEQKKINIMGGTHYSTEKFACIAMCDYFKKLGLVSEFIEETPLFEDM